MPEENPYQPPLGPCAVEVAPDLDGPLIASGNRRFLNLLVDNIVCRAFIILVFIGLALFDDSWIQRPVTEFSISCLLVLVYFVSQEILWGRTIGKFVTGTKVVAMDGSDCTVTQVVGRTLCRFIPFEPFSFLFNRYPVGWHDKFSGTRVILIRR
jgi:uncharacterized RDD family membrane protein YckC